MAWNKARRDGGSDGVSTGRDGVKRGGKGGSAGSKGNPDTEKDYDKRGAKSRSPDLDPVETADCAACNGTGKVSADRLESDEDGGFTGTQRTNCTACNGTGRVSGT